MKNTIVLASSSPRRQELLTKVNIPYTIRTVSIDESKIKINDPLAKVKKLAKLKNEVISFKQENEIIISADTIVSYNNRIFEKPINKTDAYEMISHLSGQVHDVFTSVMIRSKLHRKLFVEQTEVEFWPLSAEEIEQYINTEEPYDKAGGYGIQSIGAIFVKRIVGDYYNVVGLPISRVVRELNKFNL